MSAPLRRFVLLGVLLFALDAAAGAWRAPAPADGAAASWPVTDEELLFREALARGWHRSDPIVRRRLARNLAFALSLPDAPGAEQERVDEALALGMHETDPVVRRRLVQKMQLLAHEAARLEEPGEAELAAWLAAHPEDYRLPARVELVQVFFRSREDAAAAAGRAGRDPDAPLAGIDGDPFPLPRALPSHSEAELVARLGAPLAAEAMTLTPGAWAGPVRSAYGWHLLHVRGRRPARLPPLDAVRSRVREAVLEARAARRLDATIARLRARRSRS